MKTLPPQLTPFVRSDAVGAILAETLGHPEREQSLSELSRRTGVSAPVVHREVSRLIDGGVLHDRQEGRSRLVRANPDHPLHDHMSAIIASTYGPVPVLREAFEGVEGAVEVYIYGSWASRRSGETGPPPNDIDVLVVGDLPRRKLSEIASRATERLDIPVNVTRVARTDWESTEPAPFVETIRSRPLVDVRTGKPHV